VARIVGAFRRRHYPTRASPQADARGLKWTESCGIVRATNFAQKTMKALTEFLFPAPAQRTAGSIVRWWEKRRLAFNAIVGGAGLTSLTIAAVVTALPPHAHPWGLVPWQPIVIFGVLANLCYLLGPTAEILVEKLGRGSVLPTGPVLYRMGLTFSVGLALFPALIVMIEWVFRIVTGVL